MKHAWSPGGDGEAELLARLSLLVERGGAGHLLDAPVVRSDERDFPERWAPTAAAVERLLARLFWLTFVDLDVVLEDLRRPQLPGKLLSRSTIAWVETKEGAAHFQIEQIGNDNVAGLLCHEVGRAFTAWIERTAPYREAAPGDDREGPTERDGTIAAVYLGLGVVAANASQYNRVASEVIGQQVRSEWEVVTTGGLTPRELIFLLAVQQVLRAGAAEGPGAQGAQGAQVAQVALVRRDEARATLRKDLGELLDAEVARLAPHREELAQRLGIDLEASRPALERDAAPAMVTNAERPEPQLRQRSAGQRTFRVPSTRLGAGALLGLVTGIGALFAVAIAAGPSLSAAMITAVVAGLPLGGAVVGGAAGRTRKHEQCSDPDCRAVIPVDAALCPGCGASIAGTIKHANDRLEAEERLDRLLGAGDSGDDGDAV